MTDDKAISGRRIPGRDEAIATLFYACYPKLVRTGYSLAGDWAVAEELAQEAFVRLWHRWRWIRDPETAPAYLYRTVVNLGNSAIRRRALERRVASFRAEQPVGQDPVADMDLRLAIAALTPRKRACVVLRYLSSCGLRCRPSQTGGSTWTGRGVVFGDVGRKRASDAAA